jgi:phospholipid/cholesterol/gamma-HCH transport system ATP-binding protein
MNNVLEVAHLKKSFGEKNVIKELNFKCGEGESIVILGESGMGKSVTMRMIGMLLDPTSGSIKINGREIVGISDANKNDVMSRVGFLFQHCGLFDNLTVWENVAFRELYVLHMKPNLAKEMAVEALSSVGMSESSIHLKPYEISGGMQKRVAIARTLIKKPNLILLDEPTSGLDPIISEVVNNLIINTRKLTKSAMITITHDLNSALAISDKICVLRHGEFIWSGASYDIFKSDNEYVKQFVHAANINPCCEV